jgi:hypothetical protein
MMPAHRRLGVSLGVVRVLADVREPFEEVLLILAIIYQFTPTEFVLDRLARDRNPHQYPPL